MNLWPRSVPANRGGCRAAAGRRRCAEDGVVGSLCATNRLAERDDYLGLRFQRLPRPLRLRQAKGAKFAVT